jgi:hypothetical protein
MPATSTPCHFRTVILSIWLFVTIALLSTPSTDGAKVLFIVGNINSHVLFFAQFAADLAKLGHVTEILVPSNSRHPDFVSVGTESASSLVFSNFTYTTYPVAAEVQFSTSRYVSEAYMKMALSRSVIEKFKIVSSFVDQMAVEWDQDCRSLLENDQLIDRLRASR